MILRFLFVLFIFFSFSYSFSFNIFKKKSKDPEVSVLAAVNPEELKKINDSPEGIQVNLEYSRAKRVLNKKYDQERRQMMLELRRTKLSYGRKIRTEKNKEARDRIATKYKVEEAERNQEMVDLEADRAKEIDKLTKKKDKKIYKLVQNSRYYKAYIDSYSNFPRDNYFVQINSGLWLASTLTRVTVAPVDNEETLKTTYKYPLGYQPYYSLSIGYINTSINQHMDVEVVGTNLFTEEADLPMALVSLHMYSFNYYFDFKGFSRKGYVVRSFVKTGIGVLTIEPTSEQEELELSFTVGAGYYGKLAQNLDWVVGVDVTTGQFKRFTNTEGAKIRNKMLLNRFVISLRYLL